MQYIGETGRRVRDRLYEHIYSIRVSKISTPVAEHFRLPGHSQQDLKLQVIERCPDLSDNIITQTARRRRKSFWMWTIKSITPLGINHMV
jgi:hypothetical protein